MTEVASHANVQGRCTQKEWSHTEWKRRLSNEDASMDEALPEDMKTKKNRHLLWERGGEKVAGKAPDVRTPKLDI